MGQQQMDTARSPGAAAARSLWFDPPDTDEELRPTLTRQRVVAKALTLIAQQGVDALTMRTLAARLGVVPGALYRHLRSKEQLQYWSWTACSPRSTATSTPHCPGP